LTQHGGEKVEDKIYTKDEAWAYLKISPGTGDRLMSAKKITFTKIGDARTNRVIFTQSDLNDFLARCKKPVIRDSVKEIMKLIPAGAKKRDFNDDTSGFAGLIASVDKNLQAMEWELENSAWLEDETVKNTKILKANLEAVKAVAEVITDHDISFVWRLVSRETMLWEKEILPNLKLNPKYLDIGKLKTIELLAVRGHQMERFGSGFRESMPLKIRVAGDHYLISNESWTPIPPPDSNDELSFFAQRELFKIRIALKTSKPISEREKAEAAEKDKADRNENKLKLEIDLLTGE
jgi:hypothetical protein